MFNFGLESFQGCVPEAVEPAAQFAQSIRVDVVNAACSFGTVFHESCVLEGFEVLRNRRATDGHAMGQYAYGLRSGAQALEYLSARGVAEALEGITVSHD
jgi:hypothetical protein